MTRIFIAAFAFTLSVASPAAPLQAQLPICADSLPFTGDTATRGYIGPSPRSIVMMPAGHPKSMNGTSIEVRFLVNTAGTWDSLDITGFVEEEYGLKLRKALAQYRFSPASLKGCFRQGWARVTMSFGPDRKSAPRPLERPTIIWPGD